jgi:hypothetical protein
MTQDQVQAVLGEAPSWRGSPRAGATTLEEHYGNFIGIHYDASDRVYSLVFSPGDVVLRLQGTELLGPKAVANPLLVLLALDPTPFEDVGFVVFNEIGVAVSGYHDHREEQRAFTLMRPGTWTTAEGRPITPAQLGA